MLSEIFYELSEDFHVLSEDFRALSEFWDGTLLSVEPFPHKGQVRKQKAVEKSRFLAKVFVVVIEGLVKYNFKIKCYFLY